MLVVGVQAKDSPATPLSPVDHLHSHPTVPHTSKKKSKCIRVSVKDYTIKFEEGLAMGDIANNANKVLVGRVCGRTYIAE